MNQPDPAQPGTTEQPKKKKSWTRFLKYLLLIPIVTRGDGCRSLHVGRARRL